MLLLHLSPDPLERLLVPCLHSFLIWISITCLMHKRSNTFLAGLFAIEVINTPHERLCLLWLSLGDALLEDVLHEGVAESSQFVAIINTIELIIKPFFVAFD